MSTKNFLFGPTILPTDIYLERKQPSLKKKEESGALENGEMHLLGPGHKDPAPWQEQHSFTEENLIFLGKLFWKTEADYCTRASC